VTPGKVAHLFIKPARRQPMAARSEVEAVADQGLKGDASYGRSRRQVLLMEAEILERFGLRPGALRENIVVRGLRLTGLASGDSLKVGSAMLEVTGVCDPCSLVDEVQPGLQDALKGERGMLARVTGSGTIRISDTIEAYTSDDS
jgi:MOSC domain-containing protein YiiM